MNEVGGPIPEDDRLCPDFETLSRFADDELDVEAVGVVDTHLRRCARCEALTTRLRAGFGVLESLPGDGMGGTGCAAEESLILYVRNAATERERKEVEKHLAVCDPCVASLSLLHRRLRMTDNVSAPLPEAVRARALQAYAETMDLSPTTQTGGSQARVRTAPTWLEKLGGALSGLLRLPVLVPVGVAAGAILMIAVQDNWRGPLAPAEWSRAVVDQQVLRVTSPLARVWKEPTTRSEIITAVTKGTELRVAATERDWYQVVLPEGQTGWIEKDAFE